MLSRLNLRSYSNLLKIKDNIKLPHITNFSTYLHETTIKHSLIRNVSFAFVNIPTQSRYHLEELPSKVNQILQLIIKEDKLNQKGILLQHLTEIILNDPKIILTKYQQSTINNQLFLWKGRSGRFQKIATIAWVIRKLHLFKKHKDLYNQIAERVSNDEWYVNFDESLKALEAFTDVEDQQLKQYIYPRIERNINITVWQFNMLYYQRIVMGLLQNGRFESQIWHKLQDHILTNLGMEYSLKTITDIFTCFALAGKGSDVFYQQLQKAIYLGHWFNYDYKHKILPGYDQTGQFYALLVQTYSLAKSNTQITLIPEFLQYIYKGVKDRKTNYQKLESFTRIIKFLPNLFEQQDEQEIMKNLLQNKKPISIAYYEMIDFYDLMTERQIKVPEKLHQHIENMLILDIKRKLIPSSKILEIYQQLSNRNYLFDSKTFMQAVVNAVFSDYKYLEAQQAKAVMELSAKSQFLSLQTKQILSLPAK